MTDDSSHSVILTPEERQERNRNEVRQAILQTARTIMRERGVTSLNLNEIARRIGMTPPALYGYFDNKAAIYDTLYEEGVKIAYEFDQGVWHSYEPGWEQIRAWFEVRLRFTMEHPELYQLMFGSPVPGFTPSAAGDEARRRQLQATVDGFKRIIDAGVIRPDLPLDRAVDLLLAMRHGIVAERFGKSIVVPPESKRFQHLIDDAISMLRAAWSA